MNSSSKHIVATCCFLNRQLVYAQQFSQIQKAGEVCRCAEGLWREVDKQMVRSQLTLVLQWSLHVVRGREEEEKTRINQVVCVCYQIYQHGEADEGL